MIFSYAAKSAVAFTSKFNMTINVATLVMSLFFNVMNVKNFTNI